MSNEALELPGINHVSHHDWWGANTRPLNSDELAVLEVQFAGTGVDSEALGLAVDRAVMHAAARRQDAQRTNLAKMHLTPSREADYEQFARDVRQVGKFVDWFMRAAGAAFEWKPVPGLDTSHVALELGGMSQYVEAGGWEAARPLDMLEHTVLPVRLAEVGLRFTHANKRQGMRTYTLLPLYDADTFVDPGQFDYALLRRDRSVGYVVGDHAGRRRQVEIRKHSAALAIMSQFPDQQRTLIRRSFATHGVEYGYRANTTEAQLAGEVFEEAVRERAAATTFVPISANLLVVADKAQYLTP